MDNKKIMSANHVICNADPPAVYENLLNEDKNNSVLFNWKKIEWNIQWDYLFIILEQRKFIMMLNITQLNLEINKRTSRRHF